MFDVTGLGYVGLSSTIRFLKRDFLLANINLIAASLVKVKRFAPEMGYLTDELEPFDALSVSLRKKKKMRIQ